MNDAPVLQITGLYRRFYQGNHELEVLRDLDMAVNQGEAVALMGPSGSGKSTLLHAAALLEHPDDGRIQIAGQHCSDMSDAQRTSIRRNQLGFVYQFHHLLPEFTALENVVIPMRLAGQKKSMVYLQAEKLLDEMGLADRKSHMPAQLSGGEQQRVAIARALANNPILLLADEPTGNLDQATAALVFAELLTAVRERGLSMLVATHDVMVADRLDRVVQIQDGRVAML